MKLLAMWLQKQHHGPQKLKLLQFLSVHLWLYFQISEMYRMRDTVNG